MTDPALRRRLEAQGVFLHPQALAETDRIGKGTRVWAFAHVLDGAQVGENCNLCDGVFVEGGAVLGNNVTAKNHVSVWDGCRIGNDVFLGPNCVLTNDPNPRAAIKKSGDALVSTQIDDGVTIGANATIVCGVTLHRHAFIAAGAVVTRDVGECELVAGVPGRVIGHMCPCGLRLEVGPVCECGNYQLKREGERVTLRQLN
jgi:acetyltransferase-like isoleucine patch superfamily enzyme